MEDQARLELARRLWDSGQRDDACTEFEALVRSPIRSKVIADLEEITADEPSEEPMFRLLGDAYVRENRLQDALKAYRRALTILLTPSD
jgi:DNA-binding SARP family transcriptional activator